MIARKYAPDKPGIDKEFDTYFNENFGDALDEFMTAVRGLVPVTTSDDELIKAAYDFIRDAAYYRTLADLDMVDSSGEEDEPEDPPAQPESDSGLPSLPPIS